MAIQITDDFGAKWNVTKIECRACHTVYATDDQLAAIIDIDETCPKCGDGALLFDGTAA